MKWILNLATRFLPIGLVSWIPYVLFAASLVASFIMGWTIESWRCKADQSSALLAQIATTKAYAKIANKLILEKQAQDQNRQVIYRTIKEKVYEKTTGGVCLNPGSVQLWNDANLGVSSGDSARAPKTSTETSATDTEVLTNQTTNGELWKQCRDDLNAVIDFVQKTRK